MCDCILIEGALDIETDYYISLLDNKEIYNILGYEFFKGTINDINVVISKTLVGTHNSTMATTLGIQKFNPKLVINQGIAGAHTKMLHPGDIVIGEKCQNINYFKMPLKGPGEGVSAFEWELNKRAKEPKLADSKLVDIIYQNLKSSHKIYKGTLGSGDVFNREYDRIIWLNKRFGNLTEDMESIGAYFACEKFALPCIGIRVISNNELNNEEIDKTKAIDLQKSIVEVLPYLLEK